MRNRDQSEGLIGLAITLGQLIQVGNLRVNIIRTNSDDLFPTIGSSLHKSDGMHLIRGAMVDSSDHRKSSAGSWKKRQVRANAASVLRRREGK